MGNHAQLWYNLCANAVGRFCGPPFARWCVQQGGLRMYARSQCAATLCFLLVAEAFVFPFQCSVDDDDCSGGKQCGTAVTGADHTQHTGTVKMAEETQSQTFKTS